MYPQSALVPQRLAMLGLIGGTLICAPVALLFGFAQPGGTVQAFATIPGFVWELSLGIYLTRRASGHSPSSRRAEQTTS
jgi:hypothetical protein